MEFSTIPIPSAPEGAPKKLVKECQELGKAIENLELDRGAVNVLREPVDRAWKTGNYSVDREPYFSAVAAAYQVETEIRERLQIIYIAMSEVHQRQLLVARDKLLQIEEGVRERLQLPASVRTPPAAIQNEPGWHAQYAEVCAAESGGGSNATSFQNDSALLRADEARKRFGDLAADEPKRLKALVAKRARDAQDREKILAESEESQRPYRERQERVQALFKRQ